MKNIARERARREPDLSQALYIAFGVSVLVSIFTFFNSTFGIIGTIINGLFSGLFGFVGYALPLGVAFGVAYTLMTKSKVSRRLIILIGVFLFALTGFLQSFGMPVEGSIFARL